MKTTHLTSSLSIIICLFILSAGQAIANPMGTAWTYQGRLMDNNEIAAGIYDLQAKLFDSKDAGATQIGPTLTFEDGQADDGYFTIEFDFGISVFGGDARFLEIALRPYDLTDPCDFVVLDPQEITPTPYAIYAAAAPADSDWAVSNTDMYAIPAGNVGIGCTDPNGSLYSDSKTLEIAGNAPSIVLDDTAFSFQDDFEISNGGEKVLFRDATDGNNIMTIGLVGDIENKVGIGTLYPQEELDVVGNIHASGDISKSYTTGTSNPAAPVAYGFILFDGTIKAATPNITSVIWNAAQNRYEITISGEAYYYSSYVTVVTLDGFSGMPMTGGANNKLYIYVRRPDDTGYKQSNFQFITYKP